MSAAVLAALLVVAVGAAVRPRPQGRHPAEPSPPRLTGHRQLGARRPVRRRHRRGSRSREADELAAWCDSLARQIRGGTSLPGALATVAAPPLAAESLEPALLAIARGATLGQALASVNSSSPHLDVVLVVLRACAEHGGPAAEPIDRAAAALRQRAAALAEQRAHSAQARMSATVMTVLPLGLLWVLFASSGSVRAAVLTPLGICVLAVGGAVNAIGWRWMRRLIAGHRHRPLTPRARRRHAQRERAEALPDLAELTVIALRAGATPTAAVRVSAGSTPPALAATIATIDHRLRRGGRLADALAVLIDDVGPSAAAFVDALAAADRYGLPLSPVLDRLGDEVRSERRRSAEQHARTLPVRLAFPLVTCTLPSFVLLAIVPALLGAVSTLRGSAP